MNFDKKTERAERRATLGGRKISRRGVLAAGLAAPFIVPRHVLGGAGQPPPSEKFRVAAVGIGGMGFAYLRGCGDRIQAVALCDLDHNYAGKVFEYFPRARRYHDFREMFEKEEKNVDGVIVATPDHSHAIVLMAALEIKKHIYCAKPLTHTIGEARKIRAAVLAAKDIVTKSSVQSSASDGSRSTTELLNAGVIGPVRELHVWCDHPKYPCLKARPTEVQTPPRGMDWDQWIGPAPWRPYHSAYHPGNWRSWWDFGSGAVADMACHTFHAYFKELRLDAPATVYSRSSHQFDGYFNQRVQTPECQGNANMVTWEYPVRGDLPPLNLHWYDGGMKPHRPPELDDDLALANMGLLFVGEKGKLLTGYAGGNPTGGKRGVAGGLLLPEQDFRDFEPPPKTLVRCERGGHYHEWIEASKAGHKTVCPIEFGCEMTETALLGTISLRARRLIKWDAKAMRVTNSNQAHAFVDPPYRDGWRL